MKVLLQNGLPLSFLLSLPLDKIADEAQAKEFLAEYNRTAEEVWNAYTEASWTYNTNITDYNKEIMVWKQPRQQPQQAAGSHCK